MIEEAIVDAYTESERAVGFHAMIEQQLKLSFETVVLGTTVTVKAIDVTAAGNIVARPVTAAAHDGQSRFSNCGCQSRRRADGSGSEAYRAGRVDAGSRSLAPMSEYQYYEFRAIDRPLTDRQMRELRAISTRAAISRTSFSNYYTYGDLKASPRDLLVKYFDASLYFANWLFLEIAFRYPRSTVDVKALRRYAAGQTIEIRSTGRDVIVAISVESDGESFDTADDGSSWLSSLIALRADIAGGDERALYLAWLLDVQCGEINDDALEPGRPRMASVVSPRRSPASSTS